MVASINRIDLLELNRTRAEVERVNSSGNKTKPLVRVGKMRGFQSLEWSFQSADPLFCGVLLFWKDLIQKGVKRKMAADLMIPAISFTSPTHNFAVGEYAATYQS